MDQPPQSRSLMHRTYLLAKASPLSNKEVAKAIGVTPAWVSLFRLGEIKDPGVNTIQRLYESLSGEPLFKDQ